MSIRNCRPPALLSVAGLACVLAGTASAQSGTGSVRGTVRDQTAAVISGARLDLTNTATNIVLRTTANEVGIYVFPSVNPGSYVLKIESPGMQTVEVAVQVQVQQSTVYDAVMQAGSTETKITVSAEAAPLLVVDSATLGNVLERRRIEQLPINGRSIENLLVTVPGLENPKPGGNIQVRSFGMMAGAHNYYLDGAVLEQSMWNEGTIQRPPGLDTIQEFKVENNAHSAKYSRMTSIVMSTKSGTNQLHGAAFLTNRNNAYGKARARTDLGEFPELNRNEWGANVGGPVVLPKIYDGRNRTFFFGAYEGYRNNAPSSLSARVPTAAMRNGDFSGLLDSQGRLSVLYDPLTTDTRSWSRQPFSYGGKVNNIDPKRISPVAAYIFQVMPDPTFGDRNPLLESNWYGPAPNNAKELTVTSRVDHRFTDNDQFYARHTEGRHSLISVPYASLGNVPSLNQVGNFGRQDGLNRSTALSWIHTFSPTLFNELTASYSHAYRLSGTGAPGVSYADQLGLPNPFNLTGFPFLAEIGITPTQYLRANHTNRYDHAFYIFDDNVTKVVGKHEFQFGVHIRFDRLSTLPQQTFGTGTTYFNTGATSLYDPATSHTNPQATTRTGHNLGNLYLGIANYATPRRRGVYNLRRQEHAFYFQDNVKVTPRLTLNLGVRYQLTPFPGEANGIYVPNFSYASRSVVLGQPLDKLYSAGVTTPQEIQMFQNIGVKFETWDQAGLPRKGAHDNWHDWGPHLGMAYRFGDGRTSFVVRGGYSVSYFNEGLYSWMDQTAAGTPFGVNFQNFSNTSSAESPDGISAWAMRSVPTVFAGVNSRDAVTLDRPVPLRPGQTSNYFFNPSQPTPKVQDWNFTLEKEVFTNTVFRGGYVGNHGSNQMQIWPFNDATPSYIWYATTRNPMPTGLYSGVATRPYDQQTYGDLIEYRKTGWSNYHGVQMQVERSYSKGVGFQLSYVISNALRAGADNGNSGYGSSIPALNSFLPGTVPAGDNERNRFLNYRRDPSIPKHRVRFNWIVDLPFGRGKWLGRNAGGVLDRFIGGWQVAGLGTIYSTYTALATNHWNVTGEPVRTYGYDYPIEDCRSGTCYPGYLWWNGYIPSNRINSVDANGRPNGVMGVPADYKPAVTPLIPWGTTTLPPNAPANTVVSTYWDTNNVWIPLNNNTTQRIAYNDNLHPFRNQYIGGPRQWNLDASLFKRVRVTEASELRFTVDAFNIFNHPNNPNSGSDGVMLTNGQSGAARVLQLSVRFSW
ncbi:MAG: carboxypeptidase-like regulatory domain-containing protein [Bryobacterales bacterium]|nr:carboxypeptidase-like regulatory domain-containing protein [Bryobacterales bacterium]MEB2363399.1 carboxypeptidase-like regulatory domain-containing protein [Bryobacterales bacterium]